MTDKELMKFYVYNNPYVTDVEKVDNVYFCTHKYVTDAECNFAYIEGDADIKFVEAYFKSKTRETSVYCINKPNKYVKNYKNTINDDWLVCDDIKALRSKYSKLNRVADFKLIKVTLDNIAEREDISAKGFAQEGADNPYSNLDNDAYSKGFEEQFKARDDDNLVSFIIKYKNVGVACINLSINKDCCYISGYTMLPEYRRTKAGLGALLVIDYLILKKIKTVFCITEKGGYPNRLYKNLGFKSVLTGKTYTKK